jgi:hypothetical protein
MDPGWTFETFKIYVDERFAAQDKAVNVGLSAQRTAVDAALTAQKEAVIKAETATEKRFESVNEFRAESVMRQSTYVTIAEYQAELRAVNARLEEIVKTLNMRTTLLEERMNKTEGARSGLHAGWVYLGSAVALTAGLIGIFLALSR